MSNEKLFVVCEAAESSQLESREMLSDENRGDSEGR